MPRRTWNQHEGAILDSAGGFDVVECESCAFRHIVPVPTEAELANVYREEYYSTEKPHYFNHHREDLDWWNGVYDERYEVLEDLLPAGRRRILDIGSGPGFFLRRGVERGWTALGIEPSRQAAEHSRALGLEIINDFLTPANTDKLGTFDVVHMHEVLEHIPDPIGMLKLARDRLVPGGVVCVIVPNDYSPFQAVLRADGHAPWWVAPPHHVNYFDLASLERAVERAGFIVESSTTTFPIDLFLLFGDNYVGNDPLGRAVHGKRKRMEKALLRVDPALKRDLYKAFASVGVGREAVAYARRVEP